jgi:NADH dehydrogenase
MILISDTTGFIGRAVVRRLAEEQAEVRCLLRPSRHRQQLPPGIPFSTVSASMSDLPALRTTMQDVTAIFHLMGEDDPDQRSVHNHVQHTANLIEAARETGVRRFIYLSRLGADRTSAYPLFCARGEAEIAVRESELDYTILQAAITYGPGDVFTNVLVMLAKMIPFVMPIPEAGTSRFQPMWVEDLVTCLVATLDRDDLIGQTIPLGGPEHFTLEQLVAQILGAAGMQRRIAHVRTPLVRTVIDLFNILLPRSPMPYRWLDVLALGSATDLGAIPLHFSFEPRRFDQCLDYLRIKRPWRRSLVRFILNYR